MTTNQTRAEFFREIGKLVMLCQDKGITLMPYYFHRTTAKQKYLYSIGRRGKEGEKVVTYCDGVIKKSQHQSWLAVDLVCLDKDGNVDWTNVKGLRIAGYIWEDMGHTWGGSWDSFKDVYHFQH